MATYSFDVVSDFDRQELVNTLDQVRRDVGNRYDLKDSKTEIDLDDTELVITSASDMTLQAVEDILRTFVEHIAIQISNNLRGNNLKILISGGGIKNKFLMNRIKELSEQNL